ncbi:sulfurtransferase [Pseudogracilibacillus sp. SO30301A]|uniref:sulfurtransferase n=1 Tax=Pseudogracilibacillus sp. SO30301A TaxID=3098291 RepID=UPI00300E0289
MSIIVSAEELYQKMNNRNVRIIDVRTKDKEFEKGKAAYEHSHLPGAFYLDFKKDLSGENSFLPEVEELAAKLGKMGINQDSEIILYDQGNHRSASKAWLVFYYLGHDNVFVLDRGFTAWLEAGYRVTSEQSKNDSTTYNVQLREKVIVDIEIIKNRIDQETTSTLIDSRAYERYIGKDEPKYKKAGHIPGAKNYHSKLVFKENGNWKNPEELKKHFNQLDPNEEIIVSCGSGNSACMNLVALKNAGFKDVKIYPGGFSEWIEAEGNEVEQGIEEQ